MEKITPMMTRNQEDEESAHGVGLSTQPGGCRKKTPSKIHSKLQVTPSRRT